MTIAEANRFYRQDKKEYIVERNGKILEWIKEKISMGYQCYITIEEIQDMIYNIVTWYEIKYPIRQLESSAGCVDIKFTDIKNITDILDFEQLRFRLPHKELLILDCEYRAINNNKVPVGGYYDEEGNLYNIKSWSEYISLNIKCLESNLNDNDSFTINANKDGVILNGDLKLFQNYLEDYKALANIKELYEKIVNDNVEGIDYSELKNCIFNREIDLELRDKILSLVALGLLYSTNATPEQGYYRAKKYIEEFNENLKDINLTTEKIDQIMSVDYSKKEPDVHIEQNLSIDRIKPIEYFRSNQSHKDNLLGKVKSLINRK